MSINLTQEFVFETDDLKTFEKILQTIAPIVFRHHHPRLCKSSNGFNITHDGSYDEYRNDLSVVPSGSKWVVVTPNKTFHGATFQEVKAEFSTKEEAADYVSKHRVEPKPKRQWITTLEQGWSEMNSKTHVGTRGVIDACNKVMEIIEFTDVTKFYKDFVHVRDELRWFDGSIGHGYRMELSSGDDLHISMVHILYGK